MSISPFLFSHNYVIANHYNYYVMFSKLSLVVLYSLNSRMVPMTATFTPTSTTLYGLRRPLPHQGLGFNELWLDPRLSTHHCSRVNSLNMLSSIRLFLVGSPTNLWLRLCRVHHGFYTQHRTRMRYHATSKVRMASLPMDHPCRSRHHFYYWLHLSLFHHIWRLLIRHHSTPTSHQLSSEENYVSTTNIPSAIYSHIWNSHPTSPSNKSVASCLNQIR